MGWRLDAGGRRKAMNNNEGEENEGTKGNEGNEGN